MAVDTIKAGSCQLILANGRHFPLPHFPQAAGRITLALTALTEATGLFTLCHGSSSELIASVLQDMWIFLIK